MSVPPFSSYLNSKYQVRLPCYIALSHKKVHPDIIILNITNLQNCTQLGPPSVHVVLIQKWDTERNSVTCIHQMAEILCRIIFRTSARYHQNCA